MFKPPKDMTDDERHAAIPIATAFFCFALGIIVTGIGFVLWTHEVRSQIGDWIGGVFGACAALISALLLYGAIRLQMRELRIQRDELRDTRAEMKLAREVHDASRRELEEQTRIAKRAAHLEHVFRAAELLGNDRRHDDKQHNDAEITSSSRRSLQDHLAILLTSDLLEDSEKHLFAAFLRLDHPIYLYPARETIPGAAERYGIIKGSTP